MSPQCTDVAKLINAPASVPAQYQFRFHLFAARDRIHRENWLRAYRLRQCAGRRNWRCDGLPECHGPAFCTGAASGRARAVQVKSDDGYQTTFFFLSLTVRQLSRTSWNSVPDDHSSVQTMLHPIGPRAPGTKSRLEAASDPHRSGALFLLSERTPSGQRCNSCNATRRCTPLGYFMSTHLHAEFIEHFCNGTQDASAHGWLLRKKFIFGELRL